ncbi:hypothetical protein BS78_03G145900 [Paspalum vaginatum]|nr:hypothetical protein BS78_03G145900 [Paspalum vaginatum]
MGQWRAAASGSERPSPRDCDQADPTPARASSLPSASRAAPRGPAGHAPTQIRRPDRRGPSTERRPPSSAFTPRTVALLLAPRTDRRHRHAMSPRGSDLVRRCHPPRAASPTSTPLPRPRRRADFDRWLSTPCASPDRPPSTPRATARRPRLDRRPSARIDPARATATPAADSFARAPHALAPPVRRLCPPLFASTLHLSVRSSPPLSVTSTSEREWCQLGSLPCRSGRGERHRHPEPASRPCICCALPPVAIFRQQDQECC